MASQQEGAAQSATEPTEPPIMVRKRSQHAEAEANCDAAAPIAADAEAARMAGRSAMASPSSAVASYERQPEAQTGKSGRSRRTPWRDMDRDARTRYAARLIGEQVEYIEVSELRAGLAAFGPAFPLPWKEGLLERLVPLGGKPAVQLAVPNSELDFLPDEEVILPFDALHDLRLAQDW